MSSKRFLLEGNVAVRLIVPLGLAVLILCLGACGQRNAGLRLASTSDPGVANQPINNGAPGSATGPVVSYADVVSRTSPAVVTVHSQSRVRAPQQFPFMDDPMFRQF